MALDELRAIAEAARYMIPGLIAHESALKGGELLEIPDLSDPPTGNRLELD